MEIIKKNIKVLTFGLVVFLILPTVAFASDCGGIIGDTNDPNNTYYYLQLIYNIMKYAALILFVIFTVKDFFLAIINQNQDGLKKAFPNSVKRIIYTILIFLLPGLLTIIFYLFGVVDDPLCGIR